MLDSELYGHSPRERALLAQIVRHQRKGTPGLDELAPLARRGDAGLVARCALLLRLATQLAPGIHGARLRAERRGLRLELHGDDRLGHWVLARQSADDAFKATFGRPLLA